MKKTITSTLSAVFCIFCLVGVLNVSASAQEYQALQGVQTVKTMFDFRDGDTETALVHLKLVHDTYKDQAIRAISQDPEFVVVFMDVSVLLLSSNRDAFSPEQKTRLEEFDRIISAMAKDGIRLEICMFAARVLGVKPESIAPEIQRVDNGWIASLGYQQRGDALVPVF